MSWLWLTIISLFSAGLTGVIERYILKKYDWLAYAFLMQILTAFCFLPLSLPKFETPKESLGFFLLFLGIILWTAIAAVSAKSFQHIEASERISLKQIQIIFLLIFSYLFLKEPLTFEKILGSLFVFFGAFLLSYRKGQKLGKLTEIGYQLTILSSFLVALVSIVDKVALRYWSSTFYSFSVYFFPALILGGFIVKRTNKLKELIKSRWKALIIVVILQVIYYYSRLEAFKLAQVSIVFPILKLSILVGVFGGIIFLKEKERILQKIISALFMIIGAWLVTKA